MALIQEDLRRVRSMIEKASLFYASLPSGERVFEAVIALMPPNRSDTSLLHDGRSMDWYLKSRLR